MTEEKKLALLIDSDNVSAKYAQFILQEAAKYGELTYKRIYGDWEKGGNGWHYPALNNSIMPVQQTSYISGKNATDFSMIIDAMDILYSGNVDGFVLVTSDSDFTRLAIRLREAGKMVVGIGEVKTPLPFTASCHHFSYLNQPSEPIVNYDEKTLRKAVLDYVEENDDGRLDLLKIQSHLTMKYGSIDYDAMGYNRFSNFIDSFTELRRNNTFVSLKKGGASVGRKSGSEPSPAELVAVITDYLKRKGGKDDLSRAEKYVTGIFGKVDFSRFGSKRFVKFIDNQPEFARSNSMLMLASEAAKQKHESHAAVTAEAFAEDVRRYADENMPNGGNLGLLNSTLIEKYGKNYLSELGFDDFAKAVLSVTAVKVDKNNVFANSRERAEIRSEAPAEAPARKPRASKPRPEKLELNTIKREVQIQTAQSEKGISLAVLGNLLKEKYGADYLRELGFSTMKKLVSEVAGVKISGNTLKMDKKFIERTEEIEQLVRDFVSDGGRRSIKSLSTQIKKSFEEFDFTDYGYARFSDFINAIDGVRADGYYIESDNG